MGRLKDARAALERAAAEMGRLYAEEGRLLRELATFAGGAQAGTMQLMATQFASRLERVQAELLRASQVHDRAIAEMADALRAKDPITWK
jgi:hypothetical protein